MIENAINGLADSLRIHAAALAELADALRNTNRAANEPIFAKPLETGEDPMDPPFEAPAPTVKAEDALRGLPLPSEKAKKSAPMAEQAAPMAEQAAPMAEQAKPAPVVEQPKPEPKPEPVAEQAKPAPTLEDARKYVSRIIKWHSANNAGNPCPLDAIFEAAGAKRVQALTPEQCATFCEQAEAFCKKAGA